MFDLAIIGGGPAGVAAGVYAARKKLKTIFITESFGGQSVDSMGVENWIGTKHVAGLEFGKLLEDHLRAFEGETLTIKTGEKVTKIEKSGSGFRISAPSGSYESRTVLIATGSSRRKLGIPGGDVFENKGITYCASCDGPLFGGQDVAVIGGGNAAFETAAQLLNLAKSVTLLNRSDKFRADEVTVEKVLAHPNMRAIKNAIPTEIKGDKFVNTLAYEEAGVRKELPVTGIFVEIGLIPRTDFASGVTSLNEYGQIIVDSKTQRTNTSGIWAAGDSTDGLYHQNNIAAGDAVKALEDLYLYLHTQ